MIELPKDTREEFYSATESAMNFELMLSKEQYKWQYKIGPYTADYYFPRNNLVLELDGKFHSWENNFVHDRKRDKYMNDLGYCVVRVKSKVAHENPSGVLSGIKYMSGNKTYFIDNEDDLKIMITHQLNFVK